MNKNEFYKQLMEEYTFDAEKIRNNAKNGKNARQKLSPLYIGMSAAAAVCVVTVGTIAAVNMNRNNGVSIVNSGNSTLSASDRLSNALNKLEQERSSSEVKDYLVTFTKPVDSAEARAVLTQSGNINVKQLYFLDGSRTSGSAEVERIFTQGSGEITGAVVCCSGSVAVQLQNDPAVFLMELIEESDIDNITPINAAEVQTLEVNVPDVLGDGNGELDITAPPVEDNSLPQNTPDNNGNTTAEQTSEDTSESNAETTEQEASTDESGEQSDEESGYVTNEEFIDNTVEENAIVTEEGVNELETAEEQPQPVETTSVSVPSTEPIVNELKLNFPLNPSVSAVNSYLDGDMAFFMSRDIMFVRKDSTVSLYLFNGGNITELCSAAASDVRIAWISENSREMILSCIGEDGCRNRLLYVSADIESIIDLVAEDITAVSNLVGVGYNSDSKLMALCIKDELGYFIATARMVTGGELEFIDIPVVSDSKLTLIAGKGDTIYYTESVSGRSMLCATGTTAGNIREIQKLSKPKSINRNYAFTHAVVTSEDGTVGIFDPNTEKFIPVSEDNGIVFGASKDSFMNGDGCYKIVGGELVPDASFASYAAIDYRKSGSELWWAYASKGTVRITESIYSAENRASLLTFSEIGENVSADIKQALQNAVGLNNAIVLKRCGESGIGTIEQLTECVRNYYSETAANEIISRCGIKHGTVNDISSGGLKPLRYDNLILTINSKTDAQASGLLYIKAGSFAGRTGYRTVSVSFVKENGSWKLNNVLY